VARFSSDPTSEPEVLAAGGLLVRDQDGERQVAVIHRPKYMDWSLPKGKLDPGETFEQAALREVEEETGFRCELGRELPDISYRDRKGRTKQVRYWVMEPIEGEFAPGPEVDELRWIDLEGAEALLDYEHDRELVRSALAA
jgi:8-oxo-dGTP pyrophosphatase MutT (NUDIX family)